jgi:hypothetical protein
MHYAMTGETHVSVPWPGIRSNEPSDKRVHAAAESARRREFQIGRCKRPTSVYYEEALVGFP